MLIIALNAMVLKMIVADAMTFVLLLKISLVIAVNAMAFDTHPKMPLTIAVNAIVFGLHPKMSFLTNPEIDEAKAKKKMFLLTDK